MTWLTRVIGGVRGLLRRDRAEQELDAELLEFLELAIEDKMRTGLSREAAIRAARLELGSVDAVKDRVRDVGWEAVAESVWRDVCYAARSLRRAPGFAAVAALTLALGIGANTAVFTLLNAVVFRSLPVQEPGRLVSIQYEYRGRQDSFFSYPQFERLRDRARILSGLFAVSTLPRMNMVVNGQASIAAGTLVSGEYFRVLGIRPQLGRLLTLDDDRDASAVAVIGHGFWQSRFGADPAIVGKTVALNGVPVTIVGVAPPAFFGVVVGGSSDLILPMHLRDRLTMNRVWWNQPFVTWLQMVGRLAEGVSPEGARAELNDIYRQSQSDFAATATDTEQRIARQSEMRIVSAAAGLDGRVHTFAPALRFLMGIAAMVLFIACANIASLFLARSHARQREMAIRLALGASRSRVIRQLLTEGALVGAGGATLGLALAIWGSEALVRMVSTAATPIHLDTTPDLRVLGFTTLVSCSTVLLFGIAPALHATRRQAGLAMFGSRTIGAPRLSWNRALVVLQIALSLVLVFASVLSSRTVGHLLAVETGYNRQNVWMFSIDASLLRYEGAKAQAMYARIQDALATIPGVARASASIVRPIDSDAYLVGSVGFVDGRTLTGDRRIRHAFNVLGSDYFSTLQVPLLMGRDFGPQDGPGSPNVVIVNEIMASQLFPDENPIGHHIGQNAREILEVVGVVKDTKYADLVDAPRAVIYLPISQTPWATQITFLVRYTGTIERLTEAVRERLASIDANLPIYRVNTLDIQAHESVLRQRLLARVSTLFGAVALLLAAVGLYGLMSFAVAQRSKEIGIRMALGAARPQVLWMTLVDSLRLLGLGVVMGVPSGVAVMQLARSFLFGLAPTDPLTLAIAAVTLMIVGLAAGYIPARRAASVDPMVALRVD